MANLDRALGFLESPYLSITTLLGDAMVKAASVQLLGFDTTGDISLMIRISGSVAAVGQALEAGEREAKRLGVESVATRLARPETTLQSIIELPNISHPIYGGREQFLPTDYNQGAKSNMAQTKFALGILETQGLTAVLEATDAMLKAANVTLVGKEKIGAAYVTVMVRGDVAAVTAAIEAGKEAVGDLGKLIAAQVIARPHPDLLQLLP